MFTPTETKTPLPQGGTLITNGPFKLFSTYETCALFYLVDYPNWGTLELSLAGLSEKYNWTREDLRKARGNTVYFHHRVLEKDPTSEALTCWSPGRYTKLETTPLLQQILEREKDSESI